MTRAWLVVIVMIALSGCAVPSSYTCEADSECGDGQCIAGGCAFVANECPSGLRYGEYAPASLAGNCVEQTTSVADAGSSSESGSTGTETETETSTETDTSTESETETGTETGTDTDVDPVVVIAHYTFDMITPPTVPDDSGNGHDAEMDFFQSNGPGVSGMGLVFEGADRLIVPVDVLAGRDAFTVEFYASTVAPGPVRHWLVYYGDAQSFDSAPNLTMVVDYAAPPTEVPQLRWRDAMDVTTTLAGTTSMDILTWRHIAITVDAQGLQLFVDHVLEASDPTVPDLANPNLARVLIGGIPELVDGFRGRMDELRISEGALVPAQMLPLP